MFERLDLTPVALLRPAPLRTPSFVADVHPGTLVRYLRLRGFDTRYDDHSTDAELVHFSVAERRILLSRDVGVLKHKVLTRAHYVRATDPGRKLEEIVRALDLRSLIRPFTRCNSHLRRVATAKVANRVPLRVRETQRRVVRCRGCGQGYWPGSHDRQSSALLKGNQLQS